MLKAKERIEAQLLKLCKLEAKYEAVKVDVNRLKNSVQGDGSD